jgi:hypothetical protein
MALSFQEVNILGNIINDSFGKPSTTTGYSSAESGGNPMYGGYSSSGLGTANSVVTKASLQGEMLCVTSLCIVNLGPHGHQHQVISQTENELNQHINAYMKNLKNNFKKKEYAGRALKTKEDQNKRTTDVQDLNVYAETRKAYVYRRAYFEVG